MEARKYEYRSDFARHYFGAGREEGREEGLRVLHHALVELVRRRLPVLSAELRGRIEACGDADRLGQLVVEVGSAPDAAAVERLLATL